MKLEERNNQTTLIFKGINHDARSLTIRDFRKSGARANVEKVQQDIQEQKSTQRRGEEIDETNLEENLEMNWLGIRVLNARKGHTTLARRQDNRKMICRAHSNVEIDWRSPGWSTELAIDILREKPRIIYHAYGRKHAYVIMRRFEQRGVRGRSTNEGRGPRWRVTEMVRGSLGAAVPRSKRRLLC